MCAGEGARRRITGGGVSGGVMPAAVCRRKCAAESSVPRRIAVGRVLSGEMPGGRLPMEYPAAHCGGYLKRDCAV